MHCGLFIRSRLLFGWFGESVSCRRKSITNNSICMSTPVLMWGKNGDEQRKVIQ